MRHLTRLLPACGLMVVLAGLAVAGNIAFSSYWNFTHSAGNGSAALSSEISAYDPVTGHQYVVGPGGVDILDPATKTRVGALNIGGNSSPNSVAVANGKVAVAFAGADKTAAGTVVIYDTATNAPIHSVAVGANPDMVTFTPDGSKLLVANEGEPSTYLAPGGDPVGSVSIVQVSTGTVQTAGFGAFDGQMAALQAQGVRIFGPNATVSQDLKPEYIAVSRDGAKAYVTLQENNAMAVVDIATATVTEVKALGLKDHSVAGNGLDPSDRDGPGNNPLAGNILTWPVMGMYQPDAIKAYEKNGQTYLVMANEGDARTDWPGLNEEVRVGGASLDPTIFPNAAILQDNDNLGRLNVTTTGDTDNDGDLDQLLAFGARSFSIRTPDGAIVFDSGDAIEQIMKAQYPALWDDGRSDNKGFEPEGVEIAEIGGRTLLFLGLERGLLSAIMIWDITDPNSPFFIDLIADADGVGPEGLQFIYGADSWDGRNYLVVSNEVSGTTNVWAIADVEVPAPPALPLFVAGLLGLAAARRRTAQ